MYTDVETGLIGLHKLVQLHCNNCPITELILGPIIRCNETPLAHLDVTPCEYTLVQLNCGDTYISQLDVMGCTNLFKLNCRSTPIAALDVPARVNIVVAPEGYVVTRI